MRRQLRPFHTAEQLAALYARPYDHTRWPDHIERVAHTTAALDRFAVMLGARSVADLSCGDGAIVNRSTHPWDLKVLRDLATTGLPVEEQINLLAPVDVFVCSETLEHVQDPDALLAAIRPKARGLLLTTPHGESDDTNPEHYWGWDSQDLDGMLAAAGWGERAMELFTPRAPSPYVFQIWTCH